MQRFLVCSQDMSHLLHVDGVAQLLRRLGFGLYMPSMLLAGGEHTSRARGFVPVANVQLLIRTSSVFSSFAMASSDFR